MGSSGPSVITIEPMNNLVSIRRAAPNGEYRDSTMTLTWPEANKVQAELRQACVDAGITVRGT